jgi:hypothetical protein
MVGLTGLCMVGAAVLGIFHGRRGRPSSGGDFADAQSGSDQPPTHETESGRRRSAPREALRSSARSPYDDADAVRARRELQATRMFDRTRFDMLNTTRSLNVEAAGQAMFPYLEGMLTALKDIDPALIGGLRDTLSARACDHPQTDREVMFFADMIRIDPDLGSPRIFDCVFKDRKSEDVALWTMLDAWKAAGRPQLTALSAIEQQAVDPRTIRRLSTSLDPNRITAAPSGGDKPPVAVAALPPRTSAVRTPLTNGDQNGNHTR